jgi:hypothetical protein
MTSRRCLILGVALLCAVQSMGKSVDVAAYPFVKHLVSEGNGRQPLGAFVVDGELFSETHNDFSNMRIADDAGTEIPFLVRTRTEAVTSTREKRITSRVDSIRELQDNRIEIEVALTGSAEVSQAIAISTRLHNFEKLVTVYGMVGGQSWREIATEVPIVDYSRFIAYQKTRIEFAPARYRRLRLIVSDVTLERELPFKKKVKEALDGAAKSEFVETSFRTEDFRIDAIRVLGKRTAETGQRKVTEWQTVSDFGVAEDGNHTVITFKASREPVVGIKIATSAVNFSRPVLVEGRDGSGAFEALLRSVYSHIHVGDVHRDRRAVQLNGPTRRTEWRVTIDNKDSPALSITGISLQSEVRETVFLNTPASNYRALYGGGDTRRPRYDVATVLQTVGRTAVSAYRVGESTENSEYKRTRWKLRIGGKAVLSAAILLMVLALGWGVAVAAKKVESV